MYPNDDDYIKEELSKIQNLLDSGYILEQEYERRKKEITGDTTPSTPINNYLIPTTPSYDYSYNYNTISSYDEYYNSSYYSTPTINTISYNLSNDDIMYSTSEIPILNGSDSFDYSDNTIATSTTNYYSNSQINYIKSVELPTPIAIEVESIAKPSSTPKIEDTLVKSNDSQYCIMDIEGNEGHPLFQMKGPIESISTKGIYVDLKGFKREKYIGAYLKRVDNDNWKSGKVKQQCLLKNKIIYDNVYALNVSEQNHNLKLIGSCNISYASENKIDSMVSIVILEYPSCKVVFESYKMIKMTDPVVEGYTQFREVPHFIDLWNVIVKKYPQYRPSVMILNGSGINQQRSVGAATHFGIIADIPTIGVSYDLELSKGITQHFIDVGLKSSTRVSMIDKNDGNRLIGHAFRNNDGKILYVSPGHKMDAQISLEIVQKTLSVKVGTLTLHRPMPEPFYQADHLSRIFMKNYFHSLTKA